MHSAEYGELEKRPHYHAIIFGYDLPDKKLWKDVDDIKLYTSTVLDLIWGKGFTTVGDVTWDSAAYVARYSLKKINGPRAEQINPKTGLKHYERTHLHTGEITEVLPEYSTMSRNPGLGTKFFNQYGGDIYPWDECIVNGHPTRPPRFYDNLYELSEPEQMENIKRRRVELMEGFAADNTRERLADKEKVKIAQTSKLIRTL